MDSARDWGANGQLVDEISRAGGEWQRAAFLCEQRRMLLSNGRRPLEHIGEPALLRRGHRPHIIVSTTADIKGFLPSFLLSSPHQKKRKKKALAERAGAALMEISIPLVMKLARQLIGALRVFSLCK